MIHPINSRAAFALILAGLFFGPDGRDARADIITLNNGDVIKGIAEDSTRGPDWVKAVSAGMSIDVPRSRIKSIEKESLAQGYVHIGQAFQAQNKPEEAVRYFQLALRSDPAFQPAKDLLNQAGKSMDQRKRDERLGELDKVDAMVTEVRGLIRSKKFIESETLLKKASALQPDEARRAELQGVVADLYLAWARDMLDRFNQTGAEEKLNLALAARPDDEQAVALMLGIWETRPEKRPEVLKIYETMLARQPEDKLLRRKVADLYYEMDRLEDSARHYHELYKKTANPAGSALQQILVQNLERLHGKYALERDYDRAIEFATLQDRVQPGSLDPKVMTYYEYLRKAALTPADDLPGQYELAGWAENEGLDTEAIKLYKNILAYDPAQTDAQNGLDRYALAWIEEGRGAFNRREYFMAKAIAMNVQQTFPTSQEAGLRAEQLIGASNNEIARIAKTQREEARSYVAAADQYFNQAVVFYRDIFDTERVDRLAGSAVEDAKRYFRYSIQAYETAIKMDPTIGTDPISPVNRNLAEARRYLSRLETPLRPRRSYRRSDPTLRRDL